MVKSAHTSFPVNGVALRISVEDALAHGIKPGDPAVVEVTVRPHTPQEWIVEGLDRTFETEEQEAEFFGRCPIPGPEPQAATVQSTDTAGDDSDTRIRWRSAELDPRSAPTPTPAVAIAVAPTVDEAADGHPRIRWTSPRASA